MMKLLLSLILFVMLCPFVLCNTDGTYYKNLKYCDNISVEIENASRGDWHSVICNELNLSTLKLNCSCQDNTTIEFRPKNDLKGVFTFKIRYNSSHYDETKNLTKTIVLPIVKKEPVIEVIPENVTVNETNVTPELAPLLNESHIEEIRNYQICNDTKISLSQRKSMFNCEYPKTEVEKKYSVWILLAFVGVCFIAALSGIVINNWMGGK